ncbi:hypothetical protein K466DRAFT_583618 [Polyporus arcularius HHB13444]|uniref:Zn(2)-C6 fungal-type domain-containing protein n=1 Tax=Polyporus arcularius HHB13444 TaxID=1314778 RepID=A0A5C3PMM1_9APHY|nr:hypothetical protein K466DRAFT_583618 [Polyporus arcularius HHB13444]
MSSETTAAAKKRPSAASPKHTPDDDHRKKRRNRPTQSCLNCHTSKRMCDRQRPCGRCTQLGLTGLCVYEVDNPSQRVNAQDEAGRLKKRVAELESIIRELKNKPHPRWAQPGQPASDNSYEQAVPDNGLSRAGSSASASPPPTSPRTRRVSTPSSSAAAHQPSSSPSAFGSPSPLNTPSPIPQSPIDIYGTDAVTSLLNSDYDFSSLLAPYPSSSATSMDDALFGDMLDPLVPLTTEGCANHLPDEHCGCLQDHTSYTTVLELSLRLRRATEILSRYAKHSPRSDCKVHKGISDLDRFTTTALGNVVSPPDVVASQALARPVAVPTSAVFGRPPYTSDLRPTLAMPPASLAPQALQSPRAWDFKPTQPSAYPSPPWEDSFMSWEPIRHQPEWPPASR